jgi:hypothetical protein
MNLLGGLALTKNGQPALKIYGYEVIMLHSRHISSRKGSFFRKNTEGAIYNFEQGHRED